MAGERMDGLVKEGRGLTSYHLTRLGLHRRRSAAAEAFCEPHRYGNRADQGVGSAAVVEVGTDPTRRCDKRHNLSPISDSVLFRVEGDQEGLASRRFCGTSVLLIRGKTRRASERACGPDVHDERMHRVASYEVRTCLSRQVDDFGLAESLADFVLATSTYRPGWIGYGNTAECKSRHQEKLLGVTSPPPHAPPGQARVWTMLDLRRIRSYAVFWASGVSSLVGHAANKTE